MAVMEQYRAKKYLSLLGDRKFNRILDVGCGNNFQVFGALAEKEYVGIDFQMYPDDHNFTKIILDLNLDPKLPFEDCEFDLVIATESLEHFFRPDLIAKEINRVVNPEGSILISLPNEHTLMCGLGFLINKVLNQGFDLGEHKYIFDIEQIEKFMLQYFFVKARVDILYGHGVNILPRGVKRALECLSPQLFAKARAYICSKHEAHIPIR